MNRFSTLVSCRTALPDRRMCGCPASVVRKSPTGVTRIDADACPFTGNLDIMKTSWKSAVGIAVVGLAILAALDGTVLAARRSRKPAARAGAVSADSVSEIARVAGTDEEKTRATKDEVELSPDEEAAALEGLSRESIVPAAIEERLIDLPTALQLAEAENPTIALGRQAIVEAVGLRTAARGLLLPTLNAGTNYHLHQGVLQTSYGEIRNLNSQSLYVGGGARTLAAETVAVPAVRIFSHLGDALFAPLAANQIVNSRSADSVAIQNATLLTVVERYLELAMAESSLDAIHQGEDSMRFIVLSTAAFARIGQGREGDFNRARTEALLLHAEEQALQEEVAVASADLSRVLHLDPSIRLRTQPGALEIVQLIDPAYRLEDLVRMAQEARPELAARAADIAAADYRVRQENTRPFFPVVSVGFSGGAFGGGSNRQDLGVPAFWQTFGGRTDFDVMALWSLQNLGMGNMSLQRRSRAEREQAIAARGLVANRVAREVGDAYARVEAARRQLVFARQRLASAVVGAREELERTRGGESLPIESINSVNLLGQAGRALVEAIGSYDLAQFQLFVAIGQTPHAALPDPGRGAPVNLQGE